MMAMYGQGLGESLFSNVSLASCLGCQFVSADKLWQPHQSSLYPDQSHPCFLAPAAQALVNHCP